MDFKLLNYIKTPKCLYLILQITFNLYGINISFYLKKKSRYISNWFYLKMVIAIPYFKQFFLFTVKICSYLIKIIC